jgi:hypothetical protein
MGGAAAFRNHLTPSPGRDRFKNDKVCLSMTKDEAKASWREKH